MLKIKGVQMLFWIPLTFIVLKKKLILQNILNPFKDELEI